MPATSHATVEAEPTIRARILEGAGRAYGAKGYAGTRVEDIIRAAGVSRRTFYRFFRNKDDAFDSLCDIAATLFVETIQSAASVGRTPLERLENCVDAYLRFPRIAGPVYRVFHVESLQPGSRLGPRREAIFQELIEVLGEAVERELGRRVDPLVLRGILCGLEGVLIHLLARWPVDEDEERRAREAMVHLVRATLAGI